MNPQTNTSMNQAPQVPPMPSTTPMPPTQPAYVESQSSKVLRETGTVVATVGMIAGLITTIKGIFGIK